MKRCIFLFFMMLITVHKVHSIPCPAVLNGSNQWSLVDRISNCLDDTNACVISTSIQQADVGTGPYVISAPGVYTVCEDLSTTNNDTIHIAASDVTLNLNNHKVTIIGAAFLNGIVIESGVSNIKIYNGICSAPNGISIASNNKDIEIFNITFLQCQACIFNGNSVGNQNIIIRSCLMYDFALAGFGRPCIELGNCNGVLIEDCTIFSTTNLITDGIGILNPGANGAIIRRCIVQSATNGIRMIAGSVDTCLIEDCLVSNSAGPTNSGFNISGSCKLLNCVAETCNDGFSISSSTNAVLERCISCNNLKNGFITTASNNLLFDGCIAHANALSGFEIDGSSTIVLSECEASLNKVTGNGGFTIDGASSNVVIERSLAMGNYSRGINNSGTGTMIANTYSSNVAGQNMAGTPRIYQLNFNPDIFGTALTIP